MPFNLYFEGILLVIVFIHLLNSIFYSSNHYQLLACYSHFTFIVYLSSHSLQCVVIILHILQMKKQTQRRIRSKWCSQNEPEFLHLTSRLILVVF